MRLSVPDGSGAYDGLSTEKMAKIHCLFQDLLNINKHWGALDVCSRDSAEGCHGAHMCRAAQSPCSALLLSVCVCNFSWNQKTCAKTISFHI
jgi:hypothetical protein